jgi:hypothetical protein
MLPGNHALEYIRRQRRETPHGHRYESGRRSVLGKSMAGIAAMWVMSIEEDAPLLHLRMTRCLGGDTDLRKNAAQERPVGPAMSCRAKLPVCPIYIWTSSRAARGGGKGAPSPQRHARDTVRTGQEASSPMAPSTGEGAAPRGTRACAFTRHLGRSCRGVQGEPRRRRGRRRCAGDSCQLDGEGRHGCDPVRIGAPGGVGTGECITERLSS